MEFIKASLSILMGVNKQETITPLAQRKVIVSFQIYFDSTMIVTGPSFTSSTSIIAPKTPVST